MKIESPLNTFMSGKCVMICYSFPRTTSKSNLANIQNIVLNSEWRYFCSFTFFVVRLNPNYSNNAGVNTYILLLYSYCLVTKIFVTIRYDQAYFEPP